jgi:hypothetical protein
MYSDLIAAIKENNVAIYFGSNMKCIAYDIVHIDWVDKKYIVVNSKQPLTICFDAIAYFHKVNTENEIAFLKKVEEATK